jgi:hypothetical protein
MDQFTELDQFDPLDPFFSPPPLSPRPGLDSTGYYQSRRCTERSCWIEAETEDRILS